MTFTGNFYKIYIEELAYGIMEDGKSKTCGVGQQLKSEGHL